MTEATNQQATESPGCPRAKAEGSFIALAAGDALGWPQELRSKVLDGRREQSITTAFRPWIRRGGGRFYPHEEPIQAGEYSDDTQLMLAVARCRMFSGKSWWKALTRTELPLWTLYERGGGGATKRAAELWIQGTPPWKASKPAAIRRYFDAGGNGVSMRVLPHSIFYACQTDPESLMRDVVADGVATHGHPRALVGATAYAFAAWWLLRSDRTIRFGELVRVLKQNAKIWGALPASNQTRNGWLDAANQSNSNGYETEWSKVVDEMLELLERVRSGLEAGAIADDDKILRDLGCFGKAKGAGTVSAAAAVYLCARYAAQPVQAVLNAAFATNADTDTLAAMSGALMGCLAGKDWLPSEWSEVQDYEYLRRMANEVARGPSAIQDRPESLRTIGRKELNGLRDTLVEKSARHLNLDGTRDARIVDFANPRPLSKSTLAQTWRLRTTEGQTIYITKLGRSPKGQATPRLQQQPSLVASMPRNIGRTASTATAEGLKLAVANLKSMVAFYEKVLGLRPAKRSSRWVSYGALSLIDVEKANGLPETVTKSGRIDYGHQIQIRVNDLDTIYRRVEQSGSKLLNPITDIPRRRAFSCIDPEGNLVEVAERR